MILAYLNNPTLPSPYIKRREKSKEIDDAEADFGSAVPA